MKKLNHILLLAGKIDVSAVLVFLLAITVVCTGTIGTQTVKQTVAKENHAKTEEPIWTIKMFQKEQGNWLSVENKNLYVEFMESWAWTIRNIRYLGEEIVGEYGAHGSVVRVDTGAGLKDYHYIGTSHGFETVKNFSIIVDGKIQQYKPGFTCSGKEVIIRKESNLGPFDHQMEITFPVSEDCIFEKHSYKVVEDLDKRFSFLFAFMHELSTAFDFWLAVLPDWSELEGDLQKRIQGRISLGRDIKSIIFYSSTNKKGVTLVYPQVYKGADKLKVEMKNGTNKHFGTSIVDMKIGNSKLYFRPEVKKMGYKVGDNFEYSIKLIPFSAEPNEWRVKKMAVFDKAISRAPIEVTMSAYGDLITDRKSYRPLDRVTVQIKGRYSGDSQCRIRVCDAQLKLYYETEIELANNRGEVSFQAAGALGVHWIYLYFPGSDYHSRYANFLVDCETYVETGNPDYDELYPITKQALQLSRRDFSTPNGRFVGYISGDTWRIDGVWLRDWIYQLPAYCCWEQQMTCGLDCFLEAQKSDGSIPDGIKRDGSTWRAAVESDVEYILVLGVYRTWQVTGDDQWLKQALPHLKKALEYVQNDPKRWDKKHQLVKRGHTCDTWDFGIKESGEYYVGERAVVANCDQSGYYLAYQAMAKMYSHLGEHKRADEFRSRAEDYYQRANELLWDRTKYLHHVHLTLIEHPGFDESQQLAMGNVWAITRGLANHVQAVSIINEYRRRYKQTGDAYPWWSLQPGYPDELGYYDALYCRQGGYANGGLMPWVGGELCRGCFLHGMENYGLELYQQYIEHLRRTGNRVHVWYWLDGQPGFRTPNEVPNTGWGMAQWLDALLEGIAGLKDTSCQMKSMEVTPRWAATHEKQVRATLRYAVNDSYFSYRQEIDETTKTLRLQYTGSGQSVLFRVLIPQDWSVKSVRVKGQPSEFKQQWIEKSLYVEFPCTIEDFGDVEIICSIN